MNSIFDTTAPTGKEYRPFQLEGIDFLTSRRSALLADEPGLGKTAQAIGAAVALGAHTILVICPATIKLNWQREIKDWFPVPEKIVSYVGIQILTTSKDKVSVSDGVGKYIQIVIVNYDLVTFSMEYEKGTKTILGGPIYDQLVARRWDVGIFDESHYLKGRDTVRTKVILQRNRIAAHCTYKWYLTGTPVTSRPVELYPLLKANCPELIAPYDTYETFVMQFCDGYWDGPILNDRGASNIHDLHTRLKGFMLRRLKKDVLKELPERLYQLIPLGQTDVTKKLISEELKWPELKRRTIAELGGESIATHRREMALARLNQAIEHIGELMESHEKIVVFAHHREVITRLYEALKHFYPAVIHGGVPQNSRSVMVSIFQKDPKCRIFIGQIQAAGVGLDGLQGVSSTVVFVESSWVPTEIEQAVSRLDRMGQKNAVLAQFLVTEGSIEENILVTAVEKLKTIEHIVDGKGEDPFAMFK